MQPRVGAIQGQFFNLSFDLGKFYSCGYTYVLPTVSQGEIGLGWDQLGFPVR